MEFLRRMSTPRDTLDENAIKQLSRRRRTSFFAAVAIEEDPVLPAVIKPAIELFPGSVSAHQETLLISPDDTANGFVITHARSGQHHLTAVNVPTALPGSSHTKHFYGILDVSKVNSKKVKEQEDLSKKICTLTRDALSIRQRHHIDDPYNHRRLMEMEFSTSTWNPHELKASIILLGKYSDSYPMEPVRLRWRGRKASLEGVLECRAHPVMVCAKGEETEEGEYVLYIAPGMDLYVCSMIAMAVDDRVRRGSDDNSRQNSLGNRKDSETVQHEDSNESMPQPDVHNNTQPQQQFREINY